MAETHDEMPVDDAAGKALPKRRRRWPKVLGATGAIVLASLWFSRGAIVDDVVGDQLKSLNLPGTYTLESAGISRQVLTNVVIGDPARPDLTIERVELTIAPRLGLPAIGAVKVVRPRLYGSYRSGKLSFGSLDKVLFDSKSTQPLRLPDLNLTVDDGRARVDSDFGPIGAKLAGSGNLRGGFAGELAAVAPKLATPGCTALDASLYGKLTISGSRPAFNGPLRLASLDCPARGVTVRQARVQTDGLLDASFDGGEAKLVVASGALGMDSSRAGGLGGTADFVWRNAKLTARYDLALRGPETGGVAAQRLALTGVLRGSGGLSRLDGEGTAAGEGLSLGPALDRALASAQASAKGSLAEPLLAQLRGSLARQSSGSRLTANYVLRRDGSKANVIVPQASVTGGSEETLLAVSRLQMQADGPLPLRLAGNFSTGGAGLPRITGRLEQQGRGMTLIRMAMAEYRAGQSSLTLPDLSVTQAANGALGFTGTALASGPIPGGSVTQLVLPLDGGWRPGGIAELWRGCRALRWDGLAYASLTLDRREVTLCPDGGGAIARVGPQGLSLAGRMARLDLSGMLGDSPVRIASGPIAFSSSGSNRGKTVAKAVAVTFGTGDAPTRLTFADVTAALGTSLSGTFAGGTGVIGKVPLDLREAAGTWRYDQGKLTVSGASLRLFDQQADDRFAPLVAQDATLELVDKRITAEAVLREPKSQRAVTEVTIAHDLNSGAGQAVLAVSGITFDDKLQPDDLTPLALGVIANARGRVNGEGRIVWTADKVTSTGTFGTNGLDFAAAFGPTKGVVGTVEFTDLLGLVTAPDQKLTIAAINPGIETTDGVLSFALQRDGVLAINGASWPFLDGTMRLLPTRMTLGAAEVRHYVLEVQAVNAARFVEKMELSNLAATGLFDGRMPLVFDQNGGRIVGGALVSRSPGGNVSYVGELTYQDLSPMGNFAFNALRSIDYKKMTIALDGDLGGDIVTRLSFDGVSQGAGAKRNFITRQIAGLPIRMNVNVRAPFFALMTSFKQISDPTYLSGFVRAKLEDERDRRAKAQPAPAQPQPTPAKPNPAIPQPGIQPPESEKRP